MSTPLIPLDGILDEVTRRALFAFLARYRGDTLRAYGQDLKAYLTWCQQHELQPLQARRPHLELYLRWMEQRNYAPPRSAGGSPPSPGSTATPSSTGTWTLTRPSR